MFVGETGQRGLRAAVDGVALGATGVRRRRRVLEQLVRRPLVVRRRCRRSVDVAVQQRRALVLVLGVWDAVPRTAVLVAPIQSLTRDVAHGRMRRVRYLQHAKRHVNTEGARKIDRGWFGGSGKKAGRVKPRTRREE